MARYKTRLLQFSYLLLTLFWLLAGGAFLSLKLGLLDRINIQNFLDGNLGTVVIYIVGACSGAVGIYFLNKFIMITREKRRFVHESEHGIVRISPYAVQELASEILRTKLDLTSFHINLSHLSKGVLISIKARVDSETNIDELSERVQRTLRQQIMDQTGLIVERVDFYTQGVHRKKEQDKEKKSFAPAAKVVEEGDNNGA